MPGYFKIPTTTKVWEAIRDEHAENLRQFTSFTGSNESRTSYGFKKASVPLVEVQVFWDSVTDDGTTRENVECRCWLCVPKAEDE